MLLLLVENAIFQKTYSKKYLLIFYKSSNLKIIFALLAKVITFYVQISIIKSRIVKLEKPTFIGIIPKIY